LENPAPKGHRVNPTVATGGANPNVNSIFNLTTTRDPVNGAFIDPDGVRFGGAYQLGTIPRVESAMRIKGFYDEEISVIKDVPLDERMGVQRKLEMLNALNRQAFALPDVTPTDNLLGVTTSTLTKPRNVRITAKFRY
jgi:hypothetical protein